MRPITPTIVICTVAAAFTAGALTAAPDKADGAAAPTPDASLTIEASGVDAPLIKIEGFRFETSTVAAGATVRVVNNDGVAHTLTARDGSFDVFLEPGTEATFVAPQDLGTFDFFCGIHPSMTSVLDVT